MNAPTLPFDDSHDSESEIDAVLVCSDGGARGNPGPAAIGAVVYDVSGSEPRRLTTVSERIGVATNNVAEYRALIEGLRAAERYRARRLHVRADSQLLIRQLEGEYRVKQPHLRTLAREVRVLLAPYEDVTLEYVPRAQNAEADALVNAALDAPDTSAAPSGS